MRPHAACPAPAFSGGRLVWEHFHKHGFWHFTGITLWALPEPSWKPFKGSRTFETPRWRNFYKKPLKRLAEFRKWVIRRGRPKQGDQRSELTVASEEIHPRLFFPPETGVLCKIWL